MKKNARFGFRINSDKLKSFIDRTSKNNTTPSKVLDKKIEEYLNQTKPKV